MSTFEQITILEKIATANQLMSRLGKYSKNKIKYYQTAAKNDEEMIRRIGQSDCVLVTWSSKISAQTINHTNMRYIGLCATLYKGKNCNIDLGAARRKGVAVRGISEYGDYGTVEYVTAETINYFKNNGNQELNGKNIGIIGMGSVGTKIFTAMQHFGARVFYYNRTRKKQLEKQGLRYLTRQGVCKKVDVLIVCVPRNSIALTARDFHNLKAHMLINISMGTPFELKPFYRWVSKSGNVASFDQLGSGDIKPKKNISIKRYVSGYTEEARVRQVDKVEENIKAYLQT